MKELWFHLSWITEMFAQLKILLCQFVGIGCGQWLSCHYLRKFCTSPIGVVPSSPSFYPSLLHLDLQLIFSLHKKSNVLHCLCSILKDKEDLKRGTFSFSRSILLRSVLVLVSLKTGQLVFRWMWCSGSVQPTYLVISQQYST